MIMLGDGARNRTRPRMPRQPAAPNSDRVPTGFFPRGSSPRAGCTATR